MTDGEVVGLSVVGFWVYFEGLPDRLDGWVREGEKSGFTLSLFYFYFFEGRGLCIWKVGENRVGVSGFVGDNENQMFSL